MPPQIQVGNWLPKCRADGRHIVKTAWQTIADLQFLQNCQIETILDLTSASLTVEMFYNDVVKLR